MNPTKRNDTIGMSMLYVLLAAVALFAALWVHVLIKNRELTLRLSLKEEEDEKNEALKVAFHSLSLEALAKNNALFLELAKGTLQKFEEESQDDLTRRQQAIGPGRAARPGGGAA